MREIHQQAPGAKILIVDDNPTNVVLLEKILQQEGYTDVHGTTDPRAVKALHLERRFDLILLDIRMPLMDGFEVMEDLAEVIENDYLPVLVPTAQTDTETRLRALENGAKDFITKPFEQTEVLHRIRNMLEVRVLYNNQRGAAEMLETRVQERTRELRDTQLEIIRRLGRAGEYRDNETGLHVVRMSNSCQCLALAAGIGPGPAAMILHAAPMHDVGKIGIPDRILLKPGSLDANEWEVMKTHSEIGMMILGGHDSEIIRLARTIAHTHHEKWNGSGYRRGLVGEAIPLEGRITAICDVFDALTSKRPYKKA
jgi:putative two-component system response regulator